MVIYTNLFIPKRYAARVIGPIILIRPASKDDIGLLNHEKTHVRQFYRTFGLYGILNRFKKHRLNFEIEAYKEQLKYGGTVEAYADYLVNNYNLSITKEEAIGRLTWEN